MPFRNKACLCHRLFIPGNAVALFASLVLLSSTNADEKSKPKSAAKASAAGQAVRPAFAARRAVRNMPPEAVKLLNQRKRRAAAGAAGSSTAAVPEVGVREVSC